MADIFVSYKRCRRDVVQRLASALQAHGWDVWFDARLTEGEQFRREIERELAGARCAIVLWCDESIGSDFVLDEAEWAKTQGALIQVRWMDVTAPLGFGQQQAIDLVGWNRGIPALTPLINAIERLIGEPGDPKRDRLGTPSRSVLRAEIARAKTAELETRLRGLEERLERERAARESAEQEAAQLRSEIEARNSSGNLESASAVLFPSQFFLEAAEGALEEDVDLEGCLLTFADWSETPQGGDFWAEEANRAAEGGGLSSNARLALEELIAVARATGRYEAPIENYEDLYPAGGRVAHDNLGQGTVLGFDGRKVIVDFDSGQKKVAGLMLSKVE